jgi:prepilin-type N-terminal cleavage/methylation domain-containing protein/prepilin-type processing-associated H-X9-DG protein
MMPSRANPKRAFTLIELLVSISIIALLMAIVVPSFSAARESARSVMCRTRIRSLLQTTAQYIGDWNRYPPSLVNTPEPWLGGWQGLDWLGAGHQGDWYWKAPEAGRYWPYLKKKEAYLCPSDGKGIQATGRFFSYSMNGRVGLLVPGSYSRNKTDAQLPRLADEALPLFFEEDPAANLDRYSEGCFNGTDRPYMRHNRKTNVGYADGHADSGKYAAGLNANRIYAGLRFDPPLLVLPAGP